MKNVISLFFAFVLSLLPCFSSPVYGGSRAGSVVDVARKDFYDGRYLNALEGFITGLEMAGADKDSLSMMACMGYIGNIYNSFNDNSSSLSYSLAGYDIACKCGNADMQGRFLSNIVGTYCRLGNVAKAEEYYALERKVKMKDSVNQDYYLLYNRARILQARNELDSALDFHYRTLRFVERNAMGDAYRLVQISEIGNVLVKLDKYDEALEYGRLCMELSAKLGDDELMINALYIMSDAWGGLGRADETKAYRAKALSLSDSVFNAKRFYIVRNRLDVYKDSLNGERITWLSGVITKQSDALVVLALLLFLAVVASVTVWYAYHRLRRAQRLLVQRDIEDDKCGVVSTPRPHIHPGVPPRIDIEDEEEEDDNADAPLMLDSAQAALLLEKIGNIFSDIEVITDPDFSLAMLARSVESNTRYVSWVINSSYGKNFKTLLNEFRVREACRRLRDKEHYGNITIQGIYEGLGYRNASSFNRAFRQVMGMPPSVYQKLAAD